MYMSNSKTQNNENKYGQLSNQTEIFILITNTTLNDLINVNLSLEQN